MLIYAKVNPDAPLGNQRRSLMDGAEEAFIWPVSSFFKPN